MKVHRKIDAFRGDAALSSWIYRITFNTAMSRLRNGRFVRPHEVAASDDGVEPTEPSACRRSRRTGRRSPMITCCAPRCARALSQALTHLPPVYRVPVLLRDIQGLSTEEASAVLRVKPQTVKSRLHRGRLILREHLGDFAGGLALHATRSGELIGCRSSHFRESDGPGLSCRDAPSSPD